MTRFETAIEIAAPSDRVWGVMRDVDRWHEWTASITSVTRVDQAPLAVGSTVVIRQPGFPPARWTVTRLEPGRGFTWVSRSPGIEVTADHRIEASAIGSLVTLSLEMHGLFAGLLGVLTGAKTRRYLALEAAGLKQRSESGGE